MRFVNVAIGLGRKKQMCPAKPNRRVGKLKLTRIYAKKTKLPIKTESWGGQIKIDQNLRKKNKVAHQEFSVGNFLRIVRWAN